MQEERRLLREGQALKDQILSLQNRMGSDSNHIQHHKIIVKELHTIHQQLEGLQKQLTEETQPALAGAISDLRHAIQPIDEVVLKAGIDTGRNLRSLIFAPSLAAALQSFRALGSIVALVDILRAIRGIRAACDVHDYDLLRKAQLHMLRAEGRLVGVGADLDRITSDTISNRAVQRCDLDRFRIGQRDTAVQLANVRHSLKALRGGNAEADSRVHGSKAKKWFLVGLVFAVSRALPVPFIPVGPLGPIATCSAMAAAAFHAILAGIHGQLAGKISGVQHRHDTAQAEHEGLQAQYDELPCSDGEKGADVDAVSRAVRQSASPVRTATSPKHKTISWDDADETAAEECASPDSVERERQRVLDALRELIRDVKRPDPQPSAPAASRDSEAHAAWGNVRESLDAASSAAGERTRAFPDMSPAPPPTDSGSSAAPARLLASTWRPGSARGETPRPSGLRQPTATPPPPLQGYRTGRHSLTPAPVFRASVTPGPPSARYQSMTPGPAGYGQTPPPPRDHSQPRTPRGATRTAQRRPITPAPMAVRFTPGPAGAGDGGTPDLPDQLLETLAHRIEVYDLESERRRELEGIFGQLREATRAGRQQVLGCACL